MGKVVAFGSSEVIIEMDILDIREPIANFIARNIDELYFEQIIDILNYFEEDEDIKIEMFIRFAIMKKQNNLTLECLYKKSGGLINFKNYIPASLCTYMVNNGNMSNYMINEFNLYLTYLSKSTLSKIQKSNFEIISKDLEMIFN